MERKYTSLDEIEKDLHALKLKKDVDLMCLKTDYQTLVRNLSVSQLFSDSVSELTQAFVSKQKSLLSLAAGFLLRRFFRSVVANILHYFFKKIRCKILIYAKKVVLLHPEKSEVL